MTAEDLQARARAMHERALADLARINPTSPEKLVSNSSRLTEDFDSSDDTAEHFPDLRVEIASTVIGRLAQATEVEKGKLAALTPDQWLMLISMIGDIVLKIIERRNQRPKP